MTLDPRIVAALQVYPVARDRSGRAPRISDGFHSAADLAAGRAKRQHRGVDINWPAFTPVLLARQRGPYRTKWTYAPRDPDERPIMAVADGQAEIVEHDHKEGGRVTGGAVVIQHDGFGTGYHHLLRCLVAPGQVVKAGQVLGIMGGSPSPVDRAVIAGLVHLHFDLYVPGVGFVDSAPYLKGLRVLSLEEAVGGRVRVS